MARTDKYLHAGRPWRERPDDKGTALDFFAAIPLAAHRHRGTARVGLPVQPAAGPMSSPYKHKSNNALGAFVISALFALETTELDHASPHAATPYIRAALLLVAGFSLFLYLKYRKKSKDRGE